MARDAKSAIDAAERRVRELEDALARERRTVAALCEVGVALGASSELDELLELILEKLKELVRADRAMLYLLDAPRNELVSRVLVGPDVTHVRVRLGSGIAGRVAQSGRAVRLRDAHADPRFEPEWDLLTGFRTGSLLAVPLRNHLGRTIGVIEASNRQGKPEFSVEDEEMIAVLGTQAAVAIDNSSLLVSQLQKNRELLDTQIALERRVRDLELLFDLERATSSATSLESLATAALERLVMACGARGAALLLVQPESGDLVQYVLDGERPDALACFGVKAGEGFLAAALRTGGALSVPDGPSDPRFHVHVEGRLPFHFAEVFALPLEGESAPIGAIGLFGMREAPGFGEEDLALARLVTANLATAVRLFQAGEQRARQERLEAIGRLLSQVVHDFKTPMTVISGYAQLMLDADERQQRAEYLEEILRQFDALVAMQREVLEFARGEKTLFVRRVHLRKFFADLARDLGREVEGKPIELVFDVDTRLSARFDETRVARALHNLARNAVEAMADGGGTLKIGARAEGDDLVLTVADTGPGIPPEVEGRLFQSFVTAGKTGGTGLGLAIVKKIVDEHGGTIRVHSTASGAAFELRLPRGAGR
ncbi:MAG: GAF domain-containing protein [Polyangiaceae bacterium]|nr:GAF domain-containing protein [Polyangiaceae bacterium]